MATKAYKRVVEYHFEVEEEVIAITDVGKDYVCVEEVRKNGQEDTHAGGFTSSLAERLATSD